MNHIFIVGVGRSGTSLLQSILDAHSHVSFIPENGFLRDQFLKISFRYNKEKAIGAEIKQSYAQKFDDTSFNTNVSYFGDKDPRLLDHLLDIDNFFPRSVVVHIVRDPRDVVLSRSRAKWSSKWPWLIHAFLFEIQLRLANVNSVRTKQISYVEISYEGLITDARQELKGILELLDLKFEDSMYSFHTDAKKFIRVDEAQWKSKLNQPLDNTNKDKWRTDLSRRQVSIIELICTRSMKKYGYEFSYTTSLQRNVCRLFIDPIIALAVKLYPYIRLLR